MNVLYEQDGITVIHGDCREVLPTLEPVDVVITDPPYSEKVHGAVRRSSDLALGGWDANGRRMTNLGFDSITPELMRFCAEQFARVAWRWSLIFSNVEIAHEWRTALQDVGLDYVRTGAWVKLNTTPQFTGDRPAPGYESVTIAHPPGRKQWNGGGLPAVWTYPIVLNRGGNEPRLHTTQKPLQLMCRLVELFSNPTDVILDPFGGSGTTAVAAKMLGRRCIVIEQNLTYCHIAIERLRQSVLPLYTPVEATQEALV